MHWNWTVDSGVSNKPEVLTTEVRRQHLLVEARRPHPCVQAVYLSVLHADELQQGEDGVRVELIGSTYGT